MRNADTIDYRALDGKLGRYRVTIQFEVFGFRCQESYEVEVVNHANPSALAWKELEETLIMDHRVATWECSCCIMPFESGGDVKFIDEFIEELPKLEDGLGHGVHGEPVVLAEVPAASSGVVGVELLDANIPLVIDTDPKFSFLPKVVDQSSSPDDVHVVHEPSVQ